MLKWAIVWPSACVLLCGTMTAKLCTAHVRPAQLQFCVLAHAAVLCRTLALDDIARVGIVDAAAVRKSASLPFLSLEVWTRVKGFPVRDT